MRRILFLALALALSLCMTAAAFAETTVTTATVKGSGYGSAYSNSNKTIAIEQADGWYVYAADGTQLTTTPYDDISRDYSSSYYIVTLNGYEGVITANGEVIVPAQYDDIEVVSSKWIYGVVLTPTGDDQGDYYATKADGQKIYYNVDHYDFYFCGEMVGTLSRSEFASNNYAYARGDYLQIRDRDGAYHHYSPAFVDSGINESGEFYYKDREYTHTGTGQVVYNASCTLTADEVDNAYTTSRGYVIDLQGNQLFAYDYSYIGTFYNGVAYFKTNQDAYGLVDLEGHELLPGIYDSVDYSFYETLNTGYVYVEKDGLAGFASLNGMDTSATFLYPENVVTKKTPFLYAKGMDGKYIVISATAGELSQHFEDISMPGYGCPLFVGKTADGKVAVYGMNGEVVLENENWRNTYEITISRDGTFAYEYKRVNGEYVYTLYTIDYEMPEGVAAGLPEGHWICPTCGMERDTLFCPQDGTPKPVEESNTWICPVCGNEIESAFCPNDGTKKPE